MAGDGDTLSHHVLSSVMEGRVNWEVLSVLLSDLHRQTEAPWLLSTQGFTLPWDLGSGMGGDLLPLTISQVVTVTHG